MNFEDLKLTGKNSIDLSDSLEAPLLKLHLNVNEDTIIPNTNSLTISVKKSNEVDAEEKIYIFSLSKPLEINDEFLLEPVINNNRPTIKGTVIRKGDSEVSTVEEVDVEDIILYAGENHIASNYENVTIDILYPKNCDLIKTLIGMNGLDNYGESLNIDDLYFKDCFTKIEDDKINAAFNKVTLKCFDSENQNFSMDCDGNLVVNSVTTKEGSGTGLTFNDIYPVGSIYLSVNNVNPGTIFGGSWEQITDKFLLAAGTIYTAGSTGGSATNSHTHNYAHTHGVPGVSHTHNLGDNGYAKLNLASSGSVIYASMNPNVNFAENYYMRTSSARTAVSNDSTNGVILLGGRTEATTPGGTTTNSQSSNVTGTASDTNNMPPYLAVYVWQRTA